MNILKTITTFFTVLLFIFCTTHCSYSVGDYTWINKANIKTPPSGKNFILSEGDRVYVQVHEQKEVSGTFRVKNDGNITLPMAGPIPASGKSIHQMQGIITKQLKKYIVNPYVNVTLNENDIFISVLGEVRNPGRVALPSSRTILDTLAAAGGFTEFAKKGHIYIISKEHSKKLRVSFKQLVSGERKSTLFRLKPSDIVLVK